MHELGRFHGCPSDTRCKDTSQGGTSRSREPNSWTGKDDSKGASSQTSQQNNLNRIEQIPMRLIEERDANVRIGNFEFSCHRRGDERSPPSKKERLPLAELLNSQDCGVGLVSHGDGAWRILSRISNELKISACATMAVNNCFSDRISGEARNDSLYSLHVFLRILKKWVQV